LNAAPAARHQTPIDAQGDIMATEKKPAAPAKPGVKEDTQRHPRKPEDKKKTAPGHEGAQYGSEKGRPKDTGREGA
jgi:hypothetical protein